MPTYEYKCNACGHDFEEFQSMTAPPLKKCPRCGKNKLERLIGTGAALIFKGSGFYQTDYRSESYKKAKEAESKPAEGAKTDGAKAEGKTDSKPESKSDSKTESKPAAESKPKAKAGGKSKAKSD